MALRDEIIDELTIELSDDKSFNADILKVKVDNAIRKVRQARKYPDNLSELYILKDLDNYYCNIRDLALYYYNAIGGEFEKSHNENSINRTFISESDLYKGIVPFSRL